MKLIKTVVMKIKTKKDFGIKNVIEYDRNLGSIKKDCWCYWNLYIISNFFERIKIVLKKLTEHNVHKCHP